jgi:hypothetical protein
MNLIYSNLFFDRPCELLYFTIHCYAPPSSQDIEGSIFILQCFHSNQLG